MLDRTDRSLVGIWWWTVDKWLLASALLLMTLGVILVMAASPAVAKPDQSIIPTFHRAPAYLSCTGIADHVVGFNA
jgi:cell division protein FtsW (lipid II flippase)